MRTKKNSEPDEPDEPAETSSSTAAKSSDTGNLGIRKHYDASFKLQAIMKMLKGEKQTHVGHELGVSQPLLSIWKRRALAAVYREFGVVPGQLVVPRPARRRRRRR